MKRPPARRKLTPPPRKMAPPPPRRRQALRLGRGLTLTLTLPRIIYRYLLLEITPPFAVGLLAFTSIVFLGRLMKLTQMIVVKGVSLMEVLKTCFYLLPYLSVFTLPMAGTVGILLAMMRLSVENEFIAMKTSGLSYAQLLPPVLGFSMVTAFLTLLLTLYGSPWGQTQTKELLKEVVKRRADVGLQEQVFNSDFQGMMLFVNQAAKGGRLEGIFVYDYRDKENPNVVYAQRGTLNFDQAQESMIMHLFDGRVIRWGTEPGRLQNVEFKTYEVPLQLFGLGPKGPKSESEMSLGELVSALREDSADKDRYNRLLVELNQRFAMPCGALILCLIAMPLGLSHGHHGRTWGLVLGLVVFLVYYIVFTASWRLAINAKINPSLAPWLSNFLFVWVALYLWYRTVKELPLLPASLARWQELPRRLKALAISR